MEKRKLIILSGPTASGKTGLSISLAKRINGEIISADSCQVYRGMDIGTAKVTKEEMQGVRHHLIDVISPFEDWSVQLFKERAEQAVREIEERGRIPILAGGTGFYIQALLYDVDFTKESGDKALREELEKIAREEGPGLLHYRLQQIDPAAAESIHANNVKRVVRAIEFYEHTGRRISEHNEQERQKASPYNYAYFVIDMDRKILYDRIEERIDKMMAEGLLQEVETLRSGGLGRGHTSMQALGYKEFFPYFDGEYDLQEAVRILKRDTRHFAKRQITWFKRERDICWLKWAGEEEMLQEILKNIKARGIYED